MLPAQQMLECCDVHAVRQRQILRNHAPQRSVRDSGAWLRLLHRLHHLGHRIHSRSVEGLPQRRQRRQLRSGSTSFPDVTDGRRCTVCGGGVGATIAAGDQIGEISEQKIFATPYINVHFWQHPRDGSMCGVLQPPGGTGGELCCQVAWRSQETGLAYE